MRGVRANCEAIQGLRKQRGLTQEALAAAAACDVKTVRRGERGESLDLGTLRRLAGALGVRFEEVVQHGDAASERARVDVVERFWSAFNARDLDAMMELCHDDVVMRLPGAPDIPFGGEFRGKGEVRRMNQIAFETADTEPITPHNVSFFGCDDCVFVHGAAELTSQSNGVSAKLSMTHVFRLQELKIIEVNASYDSLEMNRVLNSPADG